MRKLQSYIIVVGNVGTVYEGNDIIFATQCFNEYVEISKMGVGRAGNEPVTLMEDGEIIREYEPEQG